MARRSAVLALTLALVALPAASHEAGDRAVGVVEAATPTSLVVRALDGHAVAFTVTKDTRWVEGRRPARPEEATPGRRVVVEARRTAGGAEATLVRLGVAVAR